MWCPRADGYRWSVSPAGRCNHPMSRLSQILLRHRISKLVGLVSGHPLLTLNFSSTWCDVVTWSVRQDYFVRIFSSSIPSLPLVVQREPPKTVCYDLALSWCTMVSKVKRWGVQEIKISSTPDNITLITVGFPSRWCRANSTKRFSWLTR